MNSQQTVRNLVKEVLNEAKEPPPPHVKAAYDRLDNEDKAAGEVLKKFPRGPTGLTPDHIKNSPEYRAAKQDYEKAHNAIRNFNS